VNAEYDDEEETMINGNHSVRWSRGEQILRDPLQNKDAAFTMVERSRLDLMGLLPAAVLTIEQQVAIEMEHILSKSEPLEQYIGLIALLERNETLFYRVLVENFERLTPIIYTPTVGLACERYSHIFRRPRGLFLCPSDRGEIAERLKNFSGRDIRLVVVTDNERILGLGDQGAGGMAIPVGKLMLYSAAAGIHPSHCLPVSLDVGTDNAALLEDPLYLGYRNRRMRGGPYEALVDEFVQALKEVFPGALLQWEDFKQQNAFRLLEQYALELPSFNDDIQGTAAVTLAGILRGLAIISEPLKQQRFLLVGAGAAGVGIGRLLRTALQEAGQQEPEIRRHILFMDSCGLVHEGRSNLCVQKKDFALRKQDWNIVGACENASSLEGVIKSFRPTVLIGTTGQAGDFTPDVIRAMAAGCRRPLIFALSNPTSKSECTPKEALQHSDGRALIATGSPFEPVGVFGGDKQRIGQCNNVFVFPGIGLGALISQAKRVTQRMFLAAAHALARYTMATTGDEEVLYPRLSNLREISAQIALAVARTAYEDGLSVKQDETGLEAVIEAFRWFPDYRAPAS
jgi:malic enzyme